MQLLWKEWLQTVVRMPLIWASILSVKMAKRIHERTSKAKDWRGKEAGLRGAVLSTTLPSIRDQSSKLSSDQPSSCPLCAFNQSRRLEGSVTPGLVDLRSRGQVMRTELSRNRQ